MYLAVKSLAGEDAACGRRKYATTRENQLDPCKARFKLTQISTKYAGFLNHKRPSPFHSDNE